MSKKFEALPNRMLGVEEFEIFDEAESIEQASPLSVVQELRLVSSFVIVKKESIHTLGFDEEEDHWTIIGTFNRDEGATALRNTNQWVQNHYDNATDVELTETDFERVGNQLDSE
jgi:hypothetical protein